MSKKIKLTLDFVDHILIFNIAAGWGSNSFLQKITNKGETTISDRLDRLQSMSLVQRIDPNIRAYEVSELGFKVIKNSLYNANIEILKTYCDLDSVLAEDIADHVYFEYLKHTNA